MNDTDEGIGLRKWSYQIRERDDAQMCSKTLVLSQGAIELASLSKDGEAVKHLLVTAPQLWAAANAAYLALVKNPEAPADPAFTALGEMVAKAVGKQNWKDVAQS